MRRKYAKITELYILCSELSRCKLSPTLASAHYSCPYNATGIVGRQLEQSGGNFLITYFLLLLLPPDSQVAIDLLIETCSVVGV